MLTLMLMGALSAIAVLAVMFRLGIKRFLRFPAVIDVTVSILLAWIFAGTLGGMIAAITGGLVFSGLVTVLRYVYGMTGNLYQTMKDLRSWVTTYTMKTSAAL